MAVFLWRAAGEPVPQADAGFGDVPSGSYFETAVAWLVEADITGGTAPGHFSPNQKVSRGQMAAFLFRGRRGDRIKVLWWDGDGLCLFAKRLEHGKFIWPQVTHGTVALTPAQLSMLLEGIDWRRPVRTAPNRAA